MTIFLATLLCCGAGDVMAGEHLPRFAALRSDEVNVRSGPGKRYAIQWVYRREGFPVEIVQEFDQWYEIRDFEGAAGWVHKHMLSGERTALVLDTPRPLRRMPDEASPPLLLAEPGVTGHLLECAQAWCRLQISSRKGWMPKAHLWGVYDEEEF